MPQRHLRDLLWIDLNRLWTKWVGDYLTMTRVVETRQLFNSLLSAIAFPLSAQAIRYLFPLFMELGTVTLTVPVDDVPGPSGPTNREGIKRMSPESSSLSADK